MGIMGLVRRSGWVLVLVEAVGGGVVPTRNEKVVGSIPTGGSTQTPPAQTPSSDSGGFFFPPSVMRVGVPDLVLSRLVVAASGSVLMASVVSVPSAQARFATLSPSSVRLPV